MEFQEVSLFKLETNFYEAEVDGVCGWGDNPDDAVNDAISNWKILVEGVPGKQESKNWIN